MKTREREFLEFMEKAIRTADPFIRELAILNDGKFSRRLKKLIRAGYTDPTQLAGGSGALYDISSGQTMKPAGMALLKLGLIQSYELWIRRCRRQWEKEGYCEKRYGKRGDA